MKAAAAKPLLTAAGNQMEGSEKPGTSVHVFYQ